MDVEADGLIAGNAGSHRIPSQPQDPGPTQEPVGAGIASDEAGKGNPISKMDVEAEGLIVGNADSHQDPGRSQDRGQAQDLWELACQR